MNAEKLPTSGQEKPISAAGAFGTAILGAMITARVPNLSVNRPKQWDTQSVQYISTREWLTSPQKQRTRSFLQPAAVCGRTSSTEKCT